MPSRGQHSSRAELLFDTLRRRGELVNWLALTSCNSPRIGSEIASCDSPRDEFQSAYDSTVGGVEAMPYARNEVCELDMCHKMVGSHGRNSALVLLGFQVEPLYKGLEGLQKRTTLNTTKQSTTQQKYTNLRPSRTSNAPRSSAFASLLKQHTIKSLNKIQTANQLPLELPRNPNPKCAAALVFRALSDSPPFSDSLSLLCSHPAVSINRLVLVIPHLRWHLETPSPDQKSSPHYNHPFLVREVARPQHSPFSLLAIYLCSAR
ncbi:hypothetical protein ACLB2K_019755 [Fragaria x ananassa]